MQSQVIVINDTLALPHPAFIALFLKIMQIPGLVHTMDNGEIEHEGKLYSWKIDRRERSVVLVVEKK